MISELVNQGAIESRAQARTDPSEPSSLRLRDIPVIQLPVVP